MPYTKVTRATSGQTQLVQTIAVPRTHKAQRVPSFPALERTSVLSFTDTFTVNTDPVADELPTRFVLVRDPAYPLWRHFEYPAGRIGISVFNMSQATHLIESTNEIDWIPFNPMGTVFTRKLATSTYPHVSTPLYRYDGRDYLPVISTNAAIELYFAADPGLTLINLMGKILYSTMDVVSFSVSSAMTGTSSQNRGYTWTLSSGGNTRPIGICFESFAVNVGVNAFLLSASAGTTTSGNLNGAPLTNPGDEVPFQATLPITSPPEYLAAPIVWQNTRCNAAAVLFSNVSAVMQKEGTVNAARAPSETGVNMFSAPNWVTQFASVHPKERYYGPLEKGLYTFTLPDAVSELYQEYDDRGDGLPSFRFSLDGNRFHNMIICRDPEHEASLAVTIDRHVEFKSSSVLFPYGFCTTPLESYHQAQMALASLGVFYENPVHLGAIAALARSAIIKYGPTVARLALPYVVKGANRMLTAVNNRLGKMQQDGFVKSKPQAKPQTRSRKQPRKPAQPKRR